jgi:heme iron utilization protein
MAMAEAPDDIAPPVQPRQLMRAADRAVLATTLTGQPLPWPYASLVLVAFDHDAAPLLLLSDLAEHTKNIAADARLSLLVDGTAGHAVPLAGPRLTLLGLAARNDSIRLRRRFVARHPSAELYVGFPDFHLYRVAVERGHLVGGFGKIRWIEAGELRLPADAEAFDPIALHVVEAVNRDHAAAIDAVAQKLTRSTETGWRLTGLDPEGADLRREAATARIDFAEPQLAPAAAHAALIEALSAIGGT